MSGLLASGLGPGSGIRPGETRQGDDRERLRQVAAEFESLLLAQMLKSAREASSESWLGPGEDHAGATMIELAEQQFARMLAAQGGLGLRDLIVKGLSLETGSTKSTFQLPRSMFDK